MSIHCRHACKWHISCLAALDGDIRVSERSGLCICWKDKDRLLLLQTLKMMRELLYLLLLLLLLQQQLL